MISAKIVKDSVCPNGIRLTTALLTYPRFIHAELMTHRMFSRNAASSRAIPTKKFIELARREPAVPVWWGKNEPGMKSREELDDSAPTIPVVNDDGYGAVYSPRMAALRAWLQLRDQTIEFVEKNFIPLGLHKQIINRVMEPWFHITTLVTATEWENFFALRCHPDAQPELQALADLLLYHYVNHEPQPVNYGEYHLPYSDEHMDPSWTLEDRIKVCVARCARLSYMNFDGVIDLQKDIALHDQLRDSGHWSPFEHVATPCPQTHFDGNFRGWIQYRKQFRDQENRTVDLKQLLASRQAAGSPWAKGLV